MASYLESVDSEWFNQRLVGVFVCILTAFAVMGIRLLYLQIIEGQELRRLSEINSIRLQDIDAPRGIILDRNGRTLVDNRPSFDLYIILKDAKPLDQTLARLARLMDEPVEDLSKRIQSARRGGGYTPILIKEDIGRDLLAAVEVHKYDLPGIIVHVTPRRHYIFNNHASHLLGYMGEISLEELQGTPYEDCKGGDFIGKFGVEKAWEGALRGKRGGRQVEVNARGQVVRVLKTVDAQPGQNIYLTIDHELQKIAEEQLTDKAGAVVALDPNSGKILAMASSPSFDPNWFVVGMSRDQWNQLISNPFRPLENKAIQAEYPPASTYKIVSAIAGLQEGVIDEKTIIECPGYYKYGNRIYRCWKRAGHGEVNLVKALSQSCDVYFYQVGELLGVDILAKYAKAMGLGSATQVNLDRESKGLVPTMDWKYQRFGVPWQGGETLSIVIGQGYNLVTPLQMAGLVSMVANGGTRYKPFLIDALRTADGELVQQGRGEVVGQIKIRPHTMALVRRGLWEVVNDHKGTAFGSHIANLDFSGKTGTAQVVGRPKEGEGGDEQALPKDHAWFVAYAPSENPQIAVSVIVEHGEHGSSAAAPIAREVIRSYLNVPDAESAPAAEPRKTEAVVE